jgi:hypothetical protein
MLTVCQLVNWKWKGEIGDRKEGVIISKEETGKRKELAG